MSIMWAGFKKGNRWILVFTKSISLTGQELTLFLLNADKNNLKLA